MRNLALVVVFGLWLTPALADWDVGDPYKMHYPQLPDPYGWDVDITTDFIFDDWRCTGTGPVSDVHFWGSWQGDVVGQITGVIVQVWSDVPAGADPNVTYSHPGAQLWQREFLPTEFTIRGPYTGDEGWYGPEPMSNPTVIPNDHQYYYQINIQNILGAFYQEYGTTYWLGLHARLGTVGPMFGWKTSLDHWNDDATFRYSGGWHELRDPLAPQTSLDMAFVITPEPMSVLLLLAGLGALRRR